MYAIVDIAGQQLKVEENQKIFVNRLEGKEGDKVDFDKVLLIDNDGKIQVGTPTVANTIVSATILSHMRGDTVKVFKKKRRKGYQKLNGHRQHLTQLQIESIGDGTVVRPAKKVSEPKKVVVAETVKDAEPKTAKSSDSKKDTTPKATGKISKSASVKKPAESKTVKTTAAKKKAEPKTEKKATAKTTKDKTKK
jgi:large subunit ribosomal protein L21